MQNKVNLAEAFSTFSETWTPKIAGVLNGQHVKLAKCEGEFTWHQHENEDEFFLVVAGQLDIHLREKERERCVSLRAGEFFIVPRGTVHKPISENGAQILLFEPADTLNTGDATASELTAAELQWIKDT